MEQDVQQRVEFVADIASAPPPSPLQELSCGSPGPDSVLRVHDPGYLPLESGYSESSCVQSPRSPSRTESQWLTVKACTLTRYILACCLPSFTHFALLLPYCYFLGSLPNSTTSIQTFICQNQARFKVLKLPGKGFHLGNHVPKCMPAFSSILSIRRKNKSPTQNKQTRTTTIKNQRHLLCCHRGLVLIVWIGLCKCISFDMAGFQNSFAGRSPALLATDA